MTKHERGSASLEFIVIAMGVLIPVLAITVSTASIQRAQFAVTEIARQGVRAVSLAPSDAAGSRALRRTARLTVSDFGITGSPRTTIECSASPCRSQGSLIRVTVSLAVPLAMIPALPGIEFVKAIPVTASATLRAPLPRVP